MAEIVEQQIQEMIPEFEELERLGFLTPDEIKQLIKKRRQFEYKLCKRKKELQDFYEYAIYESLLLDLLASRREKVMQSQKFHRVESVISHRLVKKLFLMTSLWPAQPNVWKFRLSFAKSRNLKEVVSTIYAEQIKFHGNDERVWVSWAQWEIDGRENFEKARQILLSRAPLYHPKSILLTKEYFRLELLYTQNLQKDSEEAKEALSKLTQENKDKIMKCVIPEIIFKNSLEKFNSAELCQQFYWIAHEFFFAHRLRDKIFREMVDRFPNDVHLWNLKAQLLVKGFVVDETKLDTIEEALPNEDEDKEAVKYYSKIISKVSNNTPKETLTLLFAFYDEALSSVGTVYLESVINDLFKILNETWPSEEFRSLIIHKILNIFQTYSSEVAAKHFLIWYELASEEKYKENELQNILELGGKKFPSCQRLQQALLPFVTKKCNVKGKKKVIESLSGKVGAEICFQLINDTEVNLQETLLERACNHTDSTLSRTLRVKHLENLKDIKEARNHYEKYRLLPPLSESLHNTMLKRELEETSRCDSKIRQIFDTCTEQFGDKQIGVWLSYIEFERKYGSAKMVSKLKEEAAKKLSPKLINDFNENKIYLETLLNKVSVESDIIVDSPAVVEEGKYDFWSRSSLPNLLSQEPVISYEAERRKKKIFNTLAKIEGQYSDLRETNNENKKKEWEDIVSLLVGKNIVFDTKKVNLKGFGLEKDIGNLFEKVHNIENNLQNKESSSASTSSVSKETEKILASSEILKPEFHNQKQLIPYYLSRNTVKRFRKKEKVKDKGKGWFNMKAPEITEEVRKDLQVLKMRSVLDPHTHYKRSDMKELPKYFQMGKVLDSALDYSSRIPKKKRKRTMAEEIMNDEDVLRYQKRKCSEILEEKNKKILRRKIAKKDISKGMKQKSKMKGKKKQKKKMNKRSL